MSEGGLFIVLYDEGTLRLYLHHGIYGQHMTPEPSEPSKRSRYYNVLGDYASCRKGHHVFFFLKRKIVYGGQIIGSNSIGAFYLNGKNGPMGRIANAPLSWDESVRTIYGTTSTPGTFIVNDEKERCQQFLLRFEDNAGLKGRYVISDDLYFQLGRFPYPLPSNSISNMGFCTLTPGESAILLDTLNRSDNEISTHSDEEMDIIHEPLTFSSSYGIQDLNQVRSEAHLEASILANPELLPIELRPHDSVICRQVPISPFKPDQMDRADICYYNIGYPLEDGTIPNVIFELKKKRAGKPEIRQVVRYLDWLEKLYRDFNINTRESQIVLVVPDTISNFKEKIPERYLDRISTFEYAR